MLALILFIAYTAYIKYSTEETYDNQEYDYGKVIQVEILNGTTETGLAFKFKDYLKSKKVDVVKTDNYTSNNVENSFIIDRIGNDRSAKTIAKLLGISSNNIIVQLNQDSLIEVSIVLGKDYKQLKVE